jgi:hypothetical protein
LIIGYYLTQLDKKSSSWPKTSGYIIHSSVSEKIDDENDKITYHPEIVFSYSVYGKKYTSDKRGIAIRTDFHDKLSADSIANLYTEGSLVTVHYNPNKHSFAVLETGSGKLHFLVIMGYSFFFMALFWFITPFLYFLLDRFVERNRQRKRR